MSCRPLSVLFVCLCAWAALPGQKPHDPAKSVFSSTKYDREKVALHAGSPNVMQAEADSLLAALKTAKEDTSKLNLLIALCLNMAERLPVSQTMTYAEQGRRLADSLLTHGGYKDTLVLKKKLARCYNIFGTLNTLKGDPDAGLTYYSKALAIRERINDRPGIANCYNNLGIMYRLKGNYLTATTYHLRSLKIAEELRDSVLISFSYYNLAQINIELHNRERALYYIHKCLLLRKKLKRMKDVSDCLTVLSGIYREKGELDKSMACNYESLRISDSLGQLNTSAHNLNNIALVHMNREEFPQALGFYEKALRIYEMLHDGYNRSRTIANIGRVYFHSHDFRTARDLILLNMDSVKKYRLHDTQEEDYDILAQCDSALGNFKEAFLYARLRDRIRYKNLNLEKLKTQNELETKYLTSKKEAENRSLALQNQVQGLELRRNKYFILFLAGILLLAFLLAVLLFRQSRLRAEERAGRLEQKLLRSQMNPHFIFNSLQAIQNYILRHDAREAIRYLSSFAKLTRGVLENSRMELIPLDKEIELLKDYLRLQKLRFGDRFDYEVHASADVQMRTIHIPPMLSQPFIENAVEHGMNDIDSGGRIDIYFSIRDRYLVMEIVDNGRGIGAAPSPGKKHSSLAIGITKERIALMNRKAKALVVFSVSDAFPAGGERKGVRVSFRLPLDVL